MGWHSLQEHCDDGFWLERNPLRKEWRTAHSKCARWQIGLSERKADPRRLGASGLSKCRGLGRRALRLPVATRQSRTHDFRYRRRPARQSVLAVAAQL